MYFATRNFEVRPPHHQQYGAAVDPARYGRNRPPRTGIRTDSGGYDQTQIGNGTRFHHAADLHSHLRGRTMVEGLYSYRLPSGYSDRIRFRTLADREQIRNALRSFGTRERRDKHLGIRKCRIRNRRGQCRPTRRFPDLLHDAYQGKLAAQLVTRSTGKWGALAGMPIAAGNLFIGTFDGSSAMADPLGATHFGLPLGQKPVRFLGHYRYISGGNVTGKDGKEIIPVRRDIGQIYAILYETDDNVQYLDGSNITTSPNIVARAMFTGIKETEGTGYELFDVTFVYEKPYDPEKQKHFRYNLAVVFAASERGAYFEGAVGSTLYIDAVQVICE